MKKCINLKPHEAATLARGETITIWRAVKPQPKFCGAEGEQGDINQWGWMTDEDPSFLPVSKCNPFPLNLPLLGKETWGDMALSGYPAVLAYKADPSEEEGWGLPPGFQWRSSTQMPPWAVRTLVTLSDARVRKPCDVTEEEAKAMGASKYP